MMQQMLVGLGPSALPTVEMLPFDMGTYPNWEIGQTSLKVWTSTSDDTGSRPENMDEVMRGLSSWNNPGGHYRVGAGMHGYQMNTATSGFFVNFNIENNKVNDRLRIYFSLRYGNNHDTTRTLKLIASNFPTQYSNHTFHPYGYPQSEWLYGYEKHFSVPAFSSRNYSSNVMFNLLQENIGEIGVEFRIDGVGRRALGDSYVVVTKYELI